MSASSRSTSSARSRITKQPPTPSTAANAAARETSDPSIPMQATEDPNIAAATSALIFPQSHNLFESSPRRPQESSSQRSRKGKRRDHSTSSSRRPAVRRKLINDREVSELLRNDGFQTQNRSPSATRSTTAESDDVGGSCRSKQSTNCSAIHARQTRSPNSCNIDSEELQYAGEWGEAIPMHPDSTSSRHNSEDGSTGSSAKLDDGPETPRASLDSTANPRRSRFIEGTMNGRSMGVASSWYNDVEITGYASGLDASPLKRASLQQHLCDTNKPLPAVPSPKSSKRRGMFRFGGHKEGGNSEENPGRKKALRSSKSIFNFRLFNTDAKESKADPADTSNVATPKASKAAKISKKKGLSGPDTDTNLLNERKRKAEEAYAEQFGFKKRSKHHTEDTANKPPLTPPTANATTVTTPLTAFRPRRDRPVGLSLEVQPNLKSSVSSRALQQAHSSLRKRPSRKDLEAENAELRALLARERERNHTVAINGDPFKDHDARNSLDEKATSFGGLENIPPVPRLPGKGALQLLEGNHLPARPKVVGNHEHASAAGKPGSKAIGVKEPFEWPEDVF